jgi:transposase
MKDDAFDDLRCPFNYKAELKRVRRGLNEKVGRYISENPTESYRDLAKEFHLSLGTLSKIARRYEGKRKPGPRPRRPPRINDSILPPPDEKNSSNLP